MTRSEALEFRAKINAIIETLSDEVAIDSTILFLPWVTGKSYALGDRIKYNNLLYKCVQAHTSQSDWMPNITPALWVNVADPVIEYPDWVQPTGAHDAYSTGDKVTYDSKHWICTYDANVYAPGVYGWEEVIN